jgi:hypothetical protein
MAAKRQQAVAVMADARGFIPVKRAKCVTAELGVSRLPWQPPEMALHDLECLKRLQKLNPSFDPSAPYVEHRHLLVAFIMDVCGELELSSITVHRGVNYLDRLLSKRTDLAQKHYLLFATACIFVAGLFPRCPSCDSKT